jgi:hypothetical protein
MVESLALQAGLKKGGAAKGELVLAIYELANCFRHGWGIAKDAFAAKQVRHCSLRCSEPVEPTGVTDNCGKYYETAANLGDSGMTRGPGRSRMQDALKLTRTLQTQ